jgi:hypothetical protein
LWRGLLLGGITVPDAVVDTALRLEERLLDVLEDRSRRNSAWVGTPHWSE